MSTLRRNGELGPLSGAHPRSWVSTVQVKIWCQLPQQRAGRAAESTLLACKFLSRLLGLRRSRIGMVAESRTSPLMLKLDYTGGL